MQPVNRHGIQTLSIGDLVDEDTAMIWRGPMINQTLLQLYRETRWHDLDYLIIDLPPGTGDTQLTSPSKSRSRALSSSPPRRTSPCSTPKKPKPCSTK